MLDFEPDNSPGAAVRRMLILLLAAVVMAFGIAARADSVHLYDQIGIDGGQVTLGQVAELKGPAARAHADVVVATLGEGRAEQTVTLDMVELALEEAGVNWGLVSLRGFNACRVTRLAEPRPLDAEAGQAVAANIETPIGLNTTLTLRGTVEQHLAERAGVTVDSLRITFSPRDAERLDVPVLGRSIEIEPRGLNTLGLVRVIARLYEGRSVAQTIHAKAEVERKLLAVVATGPVSRGDTFTRARLQVRECVLRDDNVTPITDPSVILGQQATTSLKAGDMVTVEAVRPPILIRRGEIVEVRCFIGGLIVRTVGVATEDAALGDRVRLKNEKNGDTYLATVTGDDEAVVEARVPTRRPDTTALAGGNDTEVVH